MPTWLLGFITIIATGPVSTAGNWYQQSFYLLHEDHHTMGNWEVGRDADPVETTRLINLSRPDVIQIHAKGNPGWTTYPSEIGYTPKNLRRDVMRVWRDIATNNGYRFSTYFNLGRDGEIMQRHPEWNRSRADGSEVERALCYQSGVADAYLWPMIREIMQRYQPDGWWFDGSCFTVRLCYCDACRKRFRREAGLDAPTKPADQGWEAYHEMQRQIYREFVHRTAKQIHKIDPQCLVSVNWAYSMRMPETPDSEIAYLTGDIGNRVEGLSGAAHWYDAQPLPFDLMTQLCTFYPQAENTLPPSATGEMAPKPPVQIEQEMAIVIANGGRFWVWDNPTRESGLVAGRYEFLAKFVAPFLRSRQPWCLETERVPDISLLNASVAHYAVTDARGTACFVAGDNRSLGASTCLPRLHLNYEYVGDAKLHGQDIRSPALIVEHPKRLTTEDIESLVMYVQNGGHLLLTGMALQLGKQQPLARLLGLSHGVGPKQAERLTVQVREKQVHFSHHLFRFDLAGAESLINTTDASGTQLPLFTKNPFGKGVAYYFATPLLSLHGKSEVPMEVMQAVFQHVAPSADRNVITNAPETVEIVLRRKAKCRILHLVNMASGKRRVFEHNNRRYVAIDTLPEVPACEVTLRLASAPAAIVLQPQDVKVSDWRFANGRVTISIPSFAVHQILEVRMP